MRKTRLGRTGHSVSALGQGCASVRAEPEAGAAALAAMHHAVSLGVDFFDTSDLYGVGRSEEMLGRFLVQVERPRLTVATKFGSMPGAADGVGTGPRRVNNDPAYIPRACEASLRRLGTDVIDLYYMHRRDPAVPIEDSVGAMARLVEAGKVRWIGLSEVSAATLRRAHTVHPITALQSEYSLWMRDLEAEVLPVCRELGITLVPFSPLGRGFLTGALPLDRLPPGDFRAQLPRFQGAAAAQNLRLVEQLQAMAAQREATAAQVALAWLLAKSVDGSTLVPIPGSLNPAHMSQNAAATSLTLSGEEMAELERIFAPDEVAGARYTPDEAARAGT